MQSEAAAKLELWFFRDMLESNRLRLFELFGFKPSEMDTVAKQQMVFRRILDALSTDAEPVKTAPSAAVSREEMAERLFATDWPNDKWDRFKDGDHAKERYLRMVDTVLSAQVQDVAEERYRHKKRGSTYTVIARGRLQVDGDLDNERVVIYRGDDGQTWVRPEYEFHDGRFEAVDASPASKHGDAE